MSNNQRAAGYDKVISSFVQILEGRKIVAQEDSGVGEVSFKGSIDRVDRYFIAGKHQCTRNQKESFEKVFDRFEELVRTNSRAFSNDRLNKKAALAPIEFIAIAYMIDQYGEKCNSALEKAIRDMRVRVREVHLHNVRRNQTVWNTLLGSMRGSLGSRGQKRSFQDDRNQERRRIRQRFGLS